MSRQYPLELVIAPDYSRSAFVHGDSNAEAWAALAQTKWPNQTQAIIGPEGAGKTHIGNIWALENEALCLMSPQEFTPSKSIHGQSIWVDGAAAADEFSMFTLINLAIAGDICALLLTDRTAPANWAAEIPDLKSRLRNVTVARLYEPNDDVLSFIIEKLFKDCGIVVGSPVIKYILFHADRSVDSLKRLIKDIDIAAASAKVNVTRKFVSDFMQTPLL